MEGSGAFMGHVEKKCFWLLLQEDELKHWSGRWADDIENRKIQATQTVSTLIKCLYLASLVFAKMVASIS